MKNIFNNKIFTFVLGFVIAASISVTAAIVYDAKDIAYTPDNENWEVSSVKEAIDSLYDNENNKEPFKIVNTIGETAVSSGNNDASFSQNIKNLTVNKYYLLLVKLGINATNTSFSADLTISDDTCELVFGARDYNSLKTTSGNYPGWYVRYYLCKPTSSDITVEAKLTNSAHAWMYLNAYEIE